MPAPNKERDKRILKRRTAGDTYAEIAEAEGMTRNGAFLAVKRLQPELLTALKKADCGLDKVVRRVAEHMNDREDKNVSLTAATTLLKVHGVMQNGDLQQRSESKTNIMVIVGATDERITALRSGNVTPEISREIVAGAHQRSHSESADSADSESDVTGSGSNVT